MRCSASLPITYEHRGLCMGAQAAILTATRHDLYNYGFLEKLGLRKIITAGNREDRGIMPIDSMMNGEELKCCSQNCANLIVPTGCNHNWEKFENAKTEAEEDHVILTPSLWNIPFWHLCAWCNEHLRRLFGISQKRIENENRTSKSAHEIIPKRYAF